MAQNQLVRLALWLHGIWQQRSRVRPDLQYDWTLLESRQELVRMTRHRLLLAQQHGLTLCQPTLHAALHRELSSLAEQVSCLRSASEPAEPIDLGFSHWYQEVQQIHDEFQAVSFLKSDGKLRVETAAFTLADIELGPFAIDFLGAQPRRKFSSDFFEIVALEPNPAAANAEFVHPHVKDGVLCAGEGQRLITTALESGRLADAFLLIQSTLQTYNGSSAYVQLEKWTNVPCSDCLRQIDPEEVATCRCCDSTLCDHCVSSCTMCSSSHCPGCLRGCSGCNTDCCDNCLTLSACSSESFCSECRANCECCDAIVGTNELDADTRLCPSCQEHQEENQPSPEVDAAQAAPTQEITIDV